MICPHCGYVYADVSKYSETCTVECVNCCKGIDVEVTPEGITTTKTTCEYCDCCEVAVEYHTGLDAWLCGEHVDGGGGDTGYCTVGCRLGYGCDGSC